MDWRELWGILTGAQPPVYYLSPWLAAIIIFVILLCLCYTLHRLSDNLPGTIRSLSQDYIKTTAFCSYPFGLMILRKHYGDIGYCFCNVPLNTATSLLMPTGEASPIGNWLLYIKNYQSLTQTFLRIVVQICGGISGYRLGKQMMYLDLHPDFEENISKECESALHVPVILGFVIELFGTTWDTLFHSMNISDRIVVDRFLKFCNSSICFCLGWYPTGLFREPAKAIGLTFGCRGIKPLDHIIVYSIGPLIGSFIAYRIKPGVGPNISSEKIKLKLKSKKLKAKKAK